MSEINFDPIKSATEMVRHVRVSSVLGSILFTIPFLLGSLVVVAFSSNTAIQIFLMCTIGILYLVFILCFLGILFFGNHNELKSEDHNFRMRALEVLGDQNHILEDSSNALEDTNPTLPDPKNSQIPDSQVNKLLEKDHEQ